MMVSQNRLHWIQNVVVLMKKALKKVLKLIFRKKENVTASMAAVPWRENLLEQVVGSLLPQVDNLNIYLNGWEKIPDFLNNSKINAVMSQNEAGDLGDRGKFYWCEDISGFHLTVDDDILYPDDYVEQILHGLSRYPKAVVSYHGSILNYPDFKKRNSKLTHFAKKCDKDMRVALVGTGVLAYDANKLQINLDNFKSNYWADGWFSLQARNADYRCIVLRHKLGWLKPMPTEGPDIWSMNKSNSANEEINKWLTKYNLWDSMTLFSERIRDRNLRWWVHKDKAELKTIAGKTEGAEFVKSLGFQTPRIHEIVPSLNSIPQFEQLGPSFVIKPKSGFSSNGVFVMKEGVNLLDGLVWSRQQIIDNLSSLLTIDANEPIKIIIEELLIPWDGSERIPHDYKFYTFGEEIAFCHIIERNIGNNKLVNKGCYVDVNFLPIKEQIVGLYGNENMFEKPDCWDELVRTAKKLGGAVNQFTRVDLYATSRGVVFGEFTPTPHGGRGFTKWADKWLGSMWKGVEGVED